MRDWRFKVGAAVLVCTLAVIETVPQVYASGTRAWDDSQIGAFPDVTRSHWAYEYLREMIWMGAVNGSNGLILPDQKITRAEFVKILLIAMDVPIQSGLSIPFTDVPTSHWARDIIATAYNKGIIVGKDATHFAPDASITREEIAKLVTSSTTSLEKIRSDAPPFVDINPSHWSYNYIVQAYQAGILQGKEDSYHVAPQEAASRAESFVMIDRMLNRETKTTQLPQEEFLVNTTKAVLSKAYDPTVKTVDDLYAKQFTGPLGSFLTKAAATYQSVRPPLPDASQGQVQFLDVHVVQRMQYKADVDATVSVVATDGSAVEQSYRITFVKRAGDWKISHVQAR